MKMFWRWICFYFVNMCFFFCFLRSSTLGSQGHKKMWNVYSNKHKTVNLHQAQWFLFFKFQSKNRNVHVKASQCLWKHNEKIKYSIFSDTIQPTVSNILMMLHWANPTSPQLRVPNDRLCVQRRFLSFFFLRPDSKMAQDVFQRTTWHNAEKQENTSRVEFSIHPLSAQRLVLTHIQNTLSEDVMTHLSRTATYVGSVDHPVALSHVR